jgi:hypothetical protein
MSAFPGGHVGNCSCIPGMSAFPGGQIRRWMICLPVGMALRRADAALRQVSERLASGPPDWANT